MVARYKIFYTDRSYLLWKNVAPNGDPKQIPSDMRIGVHSIIQPFNSGTMREVIEQYHYIFSIRDNAWVGVGLDGLLDYLANDFENIRCILHGRTVTTDAFWAFRDEIERDPDIVGARGATGETGPTGATGA